MPSVLIVEDEQHLADGLRFNLEAEGYRVAVAGDGETALELLLSPDRHFDMVVLDVMLPGKSGFEVAAELRQAGQYVPILMLTARDQPQDVLQGFESGASHPRLHRVGTGLTKRGCIHGQVDDHRRP